MARKGSILKPGKYASIPHRVLSSKRLEPSDKLVYMAILDHLGKNKVAWPSQTTLARETGLSERSVRYSVKRLMKAGLIYFDDPHGRNNRYILIEPGHIFDTPAKLAGVETVEPRQALPPHPGNACLRTT